MPLICAICPPVSSMRQRRIRRGLRRSELRRPRAELEGEPLGLPGPQNGEFDLRARLLLGDCFDERLDVLDLHAVERDENVVRLETPAPPPACWARASPASRRAGPPSRARPPPLWLGASPKLNPEPARARLLCARPARQQRQPQQHNRHDPHGFAPRPTPCPEYLYHANSRQSRRMRRAGKHSALNWGYSPHPTLSPSKRSPVAAVVRRPFFPSGRRTGSRKIPHSWRIFHRHVKAK